VKQFSVQAFQFPTENTDVFYCTEKPDFLEKSGFYKPQ